MIKLEELKFQEFEKMLINSSNIKEKDVNIILEAISNSKFDMKKNPYIYSAILNEINEKSIDEIIVGNSISPELIASATKKSIEFAQIVEIQRNEEKKIENESLNETLDLIFISKEEEVNIKNSFDKISNIYNHLTDEQKDERRKKIKKYVKFSDVYETVVSFSKGEVNKIPEEILDSEEYKKILEIVSSKDGSIEKNKIEKLELDFDIFITHLEESSRFKSLMMPEERREYITKCALIRGFQISEQQIEYMADVLSSEENWKGIQELSKEDPFLENIEQGNNHHIFNNIEIQEVDVTRSLIENAELLELSEEIPSDLAEALSFSSQLFEMTQEYEASQDILIEQQITDFEFESIFEFSEIEIGEVPQQENQEAELDNKDTEIEAVEFDAGYSTAFFNIKDIIEKTMKTQIGNIKSQEKTAKDIVKEGVIVSRDEQEDVTVGI